MKKLAPIASAITTLVAASPAFAQSGGSGSIRVDQPQYVRVSNLGDLIQALVGIAMIVAALLVFLYLVWGGIAYITSGGDKGKTEEARNRISAALIGLAIVAASWAIILIVQAFFGVTIFGGDVTIPSAVN